uniref:DUF834 domain-containing protein n=1 Tax=Oryza sativa subsp. japonica TaxID=39947 RepID=Q5Z4Y1_ORYSJ|nr:hypothetical protein [Oryza sativa Japonica Group]
MDSPATPTDFSPLLSLVPRNESYYTKENLEKGIYDVIADVIIAGHGTVDTTTGKRGLGWAIRGHLRVEDDDANSPVQRTTTDDDERRPATRFNGGSTRVPDGDAPAVFGGCEGADGIPLLLKNPTVATDGSGDDASGGATRPEDRRRRRRLKQLGGNSTGDGSAWDLGEATDAPDLMEEEPTAQVGSALSGAGRRHCSGREAN